MRFVLGLIAGALVLGPVTIANATEFKGIVLAPSSDWKLRQYEDKCRISRAFGQDGEATTVWIDQGGAEPIYNVTLIGSPLRNPYGPAVRIRFGDEPETIRSYIKLTSSKGRPVLTMYGVTLTQPEMRTDAGAETGTIAIGSAREAAIETLTLRNAIAKPLMLELGPMREQFSALRDCGTEIGILLNEAARPLSKEANPPRPVDAGDWLRPEDYPTYLIRAGMDGSLSVRLTVKKNGRPGGCFIKASNRPQLFDDTVCLKLMQRARFEPARDASGNAVASYYSTKVTFELS